MKSALFTFGWIFLLLSNLKCYTQNEITIGAVLNQEGASIASTNPSKIALDIALESSPLSRLKYIDNESRYWVCKNKELIAIENGEVKWKYKLQIANSKKSTVLGQMEDILSSNSNVLALVGFPNSNMVDAVYKSSRHEIPIISSIATASKFTVGSRKHLESTKWDKSHEWFYRATSPDILRVEALYQWLCEDQQNKPLVLYMNNEYGLGLLEDFSQLNDLYSNCISYSKTMPYSSTVNRNSIDEKLVDSIIKEIQDNKDKYNAIILFGYSFTDSKVIKKIRNKTGNLSIFVLEPNINEEREQFWGKDFDHVKCVSDQLLWEGDYDVMKFTKKYTSKSADNTYLETKSIPIAAGFAYDAMLIILQSLYESIENKGIENWRRLTIHSKRKLLKEKIKSSKNIPLIMSKGQVTASHDVITKIQRNVIYNNRFYRANNVPENRYTVWILTLLGGLMGGLGHIIIHVWNKVRNNENRKLLPQINHILAYLSIGLFGSVIFKFFWGTSLFKQILPGAILEFSMQKDPFIIGLLGGFFPVLLFVFLNKKYDYNRVDKSENDS